MPPYKSIFPHLKLSARGHFRVDYYMHQRILPQPLCVHHIYYHPYKDVVCVWPQGSTKYFAVSLILQGTGFYSVFGKEWRVQAPCILMQWPGTPLRFGPDRMWEELSIDYSEQILPRLKRWRIVSKNRPCWPIVAPLAIRQYLDLLYPLLTRPFEFGQADRVDSLCQMLITDTILSHAARTIPTRADAAIQAIEKEIAKSMPTKPDFVKLATEHGLTYPTLRRLWARFFATPPAQYAQHLKIHEACRLLRDTDLMICEIADRLNFSDAYYFSKQFHRIAGLSPRAYRRQKISQQRV